MAVKKSTAKKSVAKKTVVKAVVTKPVAAKSVAKKATAKKAAPAKAAVHKPVARPEPTHQEIANLAYHYSLERGHHHHGDPAHDWARAEAHLRGKH